MKYRTKLCAVFLLAPVVTFLWASEGTDGIRTELKADDLVVVQAGEKIYQAQCASCHGPNLEGQPDWRTRDANGFLPAPPHDATGHTWHHADDLLFEITKYGPSVVINDDSEEQRSWQDEVNGTQRDGFKVTPKKKSSLIDKLLK